MWFSEYGLIYLMMCVWVCIRKNRDKHPVGKLSCFEFMMVDVSDALT